MKKDKELEQLQGLIRSLGGLDTESVTALINEVAGGLINNAIESVAQGLETLFEQRDTAVIAKLEDRIKEMMSGKAQHPEVIVTAPSGKKSHIKGHTHPVFEKVLRLCTRVNIMLIGPAGCGKTHLMEMIAKALDMSPHILSVNLRTTQGQLIGRDHPTDGYKQGMMEQAALSTRKGGGLMGLDEVDAGDSNLLLLPNSASSNGWFYNGQGQRIECPKDEGKFAYIAAANTFGRGADRQYCGRNQLDAATLSRFYPIYMDYDKEYETSIGTKEVCDWVWQVRETVAKKRLRVVAGTRWIQQAMQALEVGIELDEIKQDLTLPLTDDERKAIGVK
jgi:cobaltochelatase CobS